MDGATSSGKKSNLPSKNFSKKQVAVLNALCHANDEQRKALLRTADKALVRCICECALNVLHGTVDIKHSHKHRLSKHKHVLRKITNNGSTKQKGGGGNWKSKKRVIVQSGGAFLPLLLAPIVGTLVSKLFGGSG